MDKWPHLGHIISKDGDDNSDILNRRESFIGRANNAIYWFGKLACQVKTKLLKSILLSVLACHSIICLACYMLSPARPSVRLSVTRVHQSKTVEVRIMKFAPCGSSIHLVFVR